MDLLQVSAPPAANAKKPPSPEAIDTSRPTNTRKTTFGQLVEASESTPEAGEIEVETATATEVDNVDSVEVEVDVEAEADVPEASDSAFSPVDAAESPPLELVYTDQIDGTVQTEAKPLTVKPGETNGLEPPKDGSQNLGNLQKGATTPKLEASVSEAVSRSASTSPNQKGAADVEALKPEVSGVGSAKPAEPEVVVQPRAITDVAQSIVMSQTAATPANVSRHDTMVPPDEDVLSKGSKLRLERSLAGHDEFIASGVSGETKKVSYLSSGISLPLQSDIKADSALLTLQPAPGDATEFLLRPSDSGKPLPSVLQLTSASMPAAMASEPRSSQIVYQVAQALGAAGNRDFELRLDPAELGKVRITMSARDGQMVAVITAERPETLDLLRKNSDQLESGFAEQGFSNTSLSFEKHDDGGGEQEFAQADVRTKPDNEPGRVETSVIAGSVSDGLDIRL